MTTSTFQIASPPTHGSLGSLGAPSCDFGDCSVTVDYTPDAGATTDSFTFTATDTGSNVSDPATVTLSIVDPEAPTAIDEFFSTEAGTPVEIQLEGYDPNDHALTFQIGTSPTHGTLGAISAPTCAPGGCSANVTYTPTGPAGTSDTFTYTVSNGTQTSPPATVSVQTLAGTGLKITSSGPLTSVGITPDLNCSVNHTGDAAGEFYDGTACATLVAIGGHVYGPQDIPAGTGTNDLVYTPVSQAKSGTGSAADPFQIHTVVSAGPGLQVDQVDSYVVGQESYRTVTSLHNTTGSPVSAALYKAADCYLQDSDPASAPTTRRPVPSPASAPSPAYQAPGSSSSTRSP